MTAVKIDGVQHEFSPIPGVVEDATDVVLNLKPVSYTHLTLPTREQINLPVQEQLIVELYSK